MAPAPTSSILGASIFGYDTIVGFDPSQDGISLNGSLAGDFAAVQADMTSTATGTTIAFDANRSITLAGVAAGSLTAGNFRFT